MAVECLVVVREPKLQRAISGLLNGLGVQPRLTPNVEAATIAIRETRLDAVIVDCCDFAEGAQLIRGMRKLPANSRSIAFAIVPQNSTSSSRMETEAHFVLQQPLSIDLMSRSLRAARNLMLQESRRFFRHAVDLPITLSSSGDELRAHCTNLSAGGMALKPHPLLESNWSGKLKFDLPENGGSVEARAELAWLLPDKTSGLRFTAINDKTRVMLEQWISARVAEDEPAAQAPAKN